MEQKKDGRKLICVYDIHSSEDMHSDALNISGDDIQKLREQKYGKEKTTLIDELILNHFDSVSKNLTHIQVDKVYLDGWWVEVDTSEQGMVQYELMLKSIRDTAKRSKSHQIIVDLVEQGARLEKTEDESLVMEEVRHTKLWSELEVIRQSIKQGNTLNPSDEQEFPKKIQEFTRLKESQKERTEQRDRYMADRINKTLGEGEIGVLIVGAAHDVLPYLADDISVKEMVPNGMIRTKEKNNFKLDG